MELGPAQGAGRVVVPGVALELGDQGADGGFHGDFKGEREDAEVSPVVRRCARVPAL